MKGIGIASEAIVAIKFIVTVATKTVINDNVIVAEGGILTGGNYAMSGADRMKEF